MATSFITSAPIQNWPSNVKPNNITLHIQSNTARFISPFTRTSQTQENPGAVVTLSAQFPMLREDKARPLRAMLAKLRGSAGRFYFPASRCGYAVPSQYASERLTVIAFTVDTTKIKCDTTRYTIDATVYALESVFTPDGTGSSTTINGTIWTNSGRNPIQVGNYLSFDDSSGWRQLHMMVDIVSDPVTGLSTIKVEPPMRERPTSLTPIHINYPSGIFMLTDDAQGSIAQMPAGYSQLQIEAVQAFPLKVVV